MEKKELSVVAGILVRNGKILGVKRGKGNLRGYWEFPGGKIEENETPEYALKRELKEELNIEINILRELTKVYYSYEDFDICLLCFICEIKSGEITLQEHEELKWMRAEELESVVWLPADYEILKILGPKNHFL